MIGRYLKRLVVEAVKETLDLPTTAQPEGRHGSARMRDDIDTMVMHGAHLSTIAAELSEYSHKNIHDLRNIMTTMQLMLDQMREEVARQEQEIATHLKAVPTANVPEPPA